MGPDAAIAGTSLAIGSRAAGIFGLGKYVESRSGYARSNRRLFRDAEKELHTLVNNAAVLLNRCPEYEGFEGTEFTWFSNIKLLIDDFKSSKIAKEIATRWSLARDNIEKFESNDGFKNEHYKPMKAVEAQEKIYRRLGFFGLNAAHIGEKSMEFYHKAQVLNKEFDEKLGKLNKENALYKKRRNAHLPPQTDMNDLLIRASKMLNECPTVDGGIHDLQFNWFVGVKELIADIKNSKIATEIPDGWSHVRDNIDKFSANEWYRPEDYARVDPADINKPLVTGKSDINLTGFSSRAKELITADEKNYKDGQRVTPLYKTKPRCTLPPDYERERFITFEGRSGTKDKILRSLKEHGVTLIHGPGGIGKTTMLYQIAATTEKDGLFDRVVYAKVPRNPGEAAIQDTAIQDIQLKIAKQLGVPWPPSPSVVTADDRSAELEKQIAELGIEWKKKKTAELGKVLVILDDVWKASDVTTMGIPSTPPAGVKVLIGTRVSGLSFRTDSGGPSPR